MHGVVAAFNLAQKNFAHANTASSNVLPDFLGSATCPDNFANCRRMIEGEFHFNPHIDEDFVGTQALFQQILAVVRILMSNHRQIASVLTPTLQCRKTQRSNNRCLLDQVLAKTRELRTRLSYSKMRSTVPVVQFEAVFRILSSHKSNAAHMQIRFPKPLRKGDLIAVTAPSSGVGSTAIARLELVLNHLRNCGYRIVEGKCLRNQSQDASASSAERANELLHFLHDAQVAAIFPPWGGELASEILGLIDFTALRALEPKWLLGYSDISTLHLPLTLLSGWATAHGPNLMDLAPTQTDPLTAGTLSVLAHDFSKPLVQRSSLLFQKNWIDFAQRADAPLNLTETTQWKRLDGTKSALRMRGRLIGGCVDTIAWLAGTQYGDVPQFIKAAGQQGVIVYLENAEFSPPALVRALLSLHRHAWFENISGLLLGRSAAIEPSSPECLSYVEALRSALGSLHCPVLFDVDIGHQPPQFTLINGGLAEINFEGDSGYIEQRAGVED